ncbi:MAG: 16S rRNA (uracil(1498)-N(3))-methyltransferase [candidate division KSB1 bacterium]|nr:16S rRNA (uracil(1498)-N(3))-methyltransferase [candidate division KSB1 bacterium]
MARMPHAEFYYVKPTNVAGERLWLVEQEWHHLQVVQRARPGHRFFAVDGRGRCYHCELVAASPSRGEAKIIAWNTGVGEPRVCLTIAASPLRGERFDLLVEKCTELGVTRFVPMTTARTVRFAGTRVDRWRRVALAAMKQCGRSVWPEVADPVPFAEVVAHLSCSGPRLIAHEAAGALPLLQAVKQWEAGSFPEALVLVGPEGGFADEEMSTAVSQGFVPVSLGPRRLRSETAAIVAATLIVSLLDTP